MRACESSRCHGCTPVRANKSLTDTPCAASSAASAPSPSMLWVGASRSADNGLTIFIVVKASSRAIKLARGSLAHFDPHVPLAPLAYLSQLAASDTIIGIL